MTTVRGSNSTSDGFLHSVLRAVEQHGATTLAAVSAAAAAAAAFFTWRQAVAAGRQVAISERVRVEASEPYVIVDIAPQPGATSLLLFSIQNVGPTLARNVRLSIDPPLKGGHDAFDKNLARVVAQTIPFLPPGRRLEWVFAVGFEVFGNKSLPREYTVTVNASGPAGPVEPLTYLIDLNAFEETLLDHSSVEASLMKLVDNTKGLYDVARQLRIIAESTRDRTRTDAGQLSSRPAKGSELSPGQELRLAETSASLPHEISQPPSRKPLHGGLEREARRRRKLQRQNP